MQPELNSRNVYKCAQKLRQSLQVGRRETVGSGPKWAYAVSVGCHCMCRKISVYSPKETFQEKCQTKTDGKDEFPQHRTHPSPDARPYNSKTLQLITIAIIDRYTQKAITKIKRGG